MDDLLLVFFDPSSAPLVTVFVAATPLFVAVPGDTVVFVPEDDFVLLFVLL